MPTATSSPCSDPQRGETGALVRLPPGRVWLPAGSLPAALRALELLQAEQKVLETLSQAPGADSI